MRSLGITLLLLLASGCVPSRAEIPRQEVDDRTPVEVMNVAVGTLVEKGNYYGVLEPAASVVVSAQVAGTVTAVGVEEGSVVGQDGLLATLDEEPFRLAEEQAAQAVAGVEVRIEQLSKAIDVERRALEAGHAQARAALDMAQARLMLVEKGARSDEKKQMAAGKDAARAALDNARIERDRVQSLFRDGAATSQQVDGSQAAYEASLARFEQAEAAWRVVVTGAREEDKETARAAVRQAEAALRNAEAQQDNLEVREKELEALRIQLKSAGLSLDLARYNRGKTTLRSPVKGQTVVAMKNLDAGETVAPGVPLFELLEMQTMKLVLQVPGRDVGYLAEGLRIPVRCIGDPDAAPPRDGKVVYVGVKADSRNTAFPVHLALDNAGRDLRAGQICEAHPELTRHSLVLLPSDVVIDSEEGKLVVVVAEGTAREQPVTVAAVRGGVAAISKGLSAGTRVVVVGHRLVRDGEDVNVVGEKPPVASAAIESVPSAQEGAGPAGNEAGGGAVVSPAGTRAGGDPVAPAAE
ncbi:MAG: efflux RND transporter periplasmic adaptor subunit [Deltaproteobacteria bacterium]|nr:efflux RND transporter periplasmic adaptor subunit [Deltaproteobacteria bacterium]